MKKYLWALAYVVILVLPVATVRAFTGFSPFPGSGAGGGTDQVGTVTDGLWCVGDASGLVQCTEAAPVGAGDVTGAGDCASGACYDGSSDGGTYIRLYDGDSHYTAIVGGNSTANLTWTTPIAAPAGNNYLMHSSTAGQLGFTNPADFVPDSLYDAHTVLYATTDNTPAALTVTEQTVVGRATGGNIAALAIDSDLSSVSANDDSVPSAKATKAVTDTLVLKSLYDAYSVLYADTDNTPAAKALSASNLLGRGASGGIDAITLGTGLSMGGAAALTLDTDLSTIAGLTATRGDLMYVGSGGTWADLAVGSANTVLTTDGTDPSWTTVTSAMITNDTITSSDLAAALTFAEGDFLDLSAITMSGTNDEGLALPFWADVTPASGATKRFITWDESGGVMKIRTATGWAEINPSAGAPTTWGYIGVSSAVDGLSAERTIAEGLAIDFTDGGANGSFTIAFDPTELTGDRTWAAGGAATNTWTWNVSTGTDPSLTFGNDLISTANSFTVATGKNITLGTTQWNSSDEIDGTKIKDADYGGISVSAAGAWTVDDATITAAKLASADFGPFTVAAGVVTIDADSINDTHIDWGTGTNQVSLDDVTDGSSYEKVAAADVSSGHVIRFYDSDESSYLTITGLATTTRAMTVPDSAFSVAGININQDISGTWEIQDGVNLNFGNGADWGISYDETTNDNLLIATAGVQAASTTQPMYKIMIDSGNAGTTPADQYVFGIYKYTTRLFSVDEDGDVYASGGYYTAASTDPGVILDETTASDTDYWLAINADQEGDNDDYFEIGTGTTKGTGMIFRLNPSGNMYVTGTTQTDSLILEGGTYDTTLSPGTPTANVTYTWPTGAPASSGYALVSTTGGVMSWSEMTATTVGATGAVQYASGTSTLAGESAFLYDATNNTLTLTQAASNPTLQVWDSSTSWNHTPQVGIKGVLETDAIYYSDGGIVMADAQTITFDEAAANPDDADIVLSGADGVFKIASANGANNEDLTIDVDQTANTVILSSTTSATTLNANTFLISANGFTPDANDGAALGTKNTAEFSDLWLASGAVIGFANDDVTITHAANALAFAGGTYSFSDDMSLYNAVNDGNPVFAIGSGANERLSITATYEAGGQLLESVTFATVTEDGDADDGEMIFSVDATEIARFKDSGPVFAGISTFATSADPDADGGATLGTKNTAEWQNLYLNTGGTIEFENGDITLTHSANTLTLGGGALALGANDLTMTGSLGATGARLTAGWFTDLTVTNAIAGSITGNAATVTVADAADDTTTWPMLATGATGPLAPATDASLTYNAATGMLTATGFTGNVTGNCSGSAATLTGTLANVAASTSAQLYGTLSDETGSASGTPLAVFNQNPTINGATGTGVWDLSGATTLEIPNSDDPDVSAAGMISWDTDGWMRGHNGTAQVAIARMQEEIHVTVVKPQDMADAVRDAFMVWSNESGMTFVVDGWKGWSGTDDTTLNIEEADADGVSNNATVDAVELATGSGPYTGSDTTITARNIEAGHVLLLDFDDTDDPSYVKLVIYGHYLADVN